MTWNSEEFKPVDIEPCWQQFERSRTPSDWIVAYQSCMNVGSMTEFLTATPITVGQLSSIVFEARPDLAEQQNDVIRGIQGHYSMNPKWLTYLTLGYTGARKRKDSGEYLVEKLANEVQLITLAKFKYDEHSITPARTDELIKNSYELFVSKFNKKDPEYEFYTESNPILAFKVKDEYTKRSFFYVTNAEIQRRRKDANFKIKIRRTSTKPDIVSTQLAKELRETEASEAGPAATNMR